MADVKPGAPGGKELDARDDATRAARPAHATHDDKTRPGVRLDESLGFVPLDAVGDEPTMTEGRAAVDDDPDYASDIADTVERPALLEATLVRSPVGRPMARLPDVAEQAERPSGDARRPTDRGVGGIGRQSSLMPPPVPRPTPAPPAAEPVAPGPARAAPGTEPRVVVDSSVFRAAATPGTSPARASAEATHTGGPTSSVSTSPDLARDGTSPARAALTALTPRRITAAAEGLVHVRSPLLRRRTLPGPASRAADALERTASTAAARSESNVKPLPKPPPSRPEPRPVIRTGREVKALGKPAQPPTGPAPRPTLPPPLPSARSLLKPAQREPTESSATPARQAPDAARVATEPQRPAAHHATDPAHPAQVEPPPRGVVTTATWSPVRIPHAPTAAVTRDESSGLKPLPPGSAKPIERATRAPEQRETLTEAAVASADPRLTPLRPPPAVRHQSLSESIRQKASPGQAAMAEVERPLRTATVTAASGRRRRTQLGVLSVLTLVLLFEAAVLPTDAGPPWELVLRPTEASFIALAGFLLVLVNHLLPLRPRLRGAFALGIGLLLVPIAVLALRADVQHAFDAQPALLALFGEQPTLGIGLVLALVALPAGFFLRALAPRHLAATALIGFGTAVALAIVCGIGGNFADAPLALIAAGAADATVLGDRIAAMATFPILAGLVGALAFTWPGFGARQATALGLVFWALALVPLLVLGLFAAKADQWIGVLGPIKLATLLGAAALYLAAGLARVFAPADV